MDLLEALLSGIFCAFNNVATGTVLAMNSRKEDMERNASLHWLIAEISKIIGNVFVLLIMGKGGMVPWKMRALFGTFAGFIVMAGVIASALRKPLVQSKTPPSPMKILMGIWRLVSNRDMWLYMITFSYVGWLGAYQVGIYSSKVAYTPAFHGQIGKRKSSSEVVTIPDLPFPDQAAAFSGMFIGVGETVAAFFFALFGRRIHYIGGYWVVITGCLIHTIAYFIIFINIPDIVEWKELIEGIQITHPGGQALASSNLKLAFFCSFLLGLGDSAFHTQIYALLGSVFERETSSAIMIFKISQKASSSLGYFIIDRIGNYATIGCLSVLLILGTATFTYVQQHPTYVSYNPVLVYTDDTSQTRDYKNADEVIDAERREEEARIQERLKAKEEKMSTRKFFRKTKEAQKEEQ